MFSVGLIRHILSSEGIFEKIDYLKLRGDIGKKKALIFYIIGLVGLICLGICFIIIFLVDFDDI